MASRKMYFWTMCRVWFSIVTCRRHRPIFYLFFFDFLKEKKSTRDFNRTTRFAMDIFPHGVAFKVFGREQFSEESRKRVDCAGIYTVQSHYVFCVYILVSYFEFLNLIPRRVQNMPFASWHTYNAGRRSQNLCSDPFRRCTFCVYIYNFTSGSHTIA